MLDSSLVYYTACADDITVAAFCRLSDRRRRPRSKRARCVVSVTATVDSAIGSCLPPCPKNVGLGRWGRREERSKLKLENFKC